MSARIGRGLGLVALVVLLGLVAVSLAGPLSSARGEDNLYVLQADAFLRGRLDLLRHYHDTAVFEGRYYVPFPPAPALLLVPVVAVLGIARTNTVVIGVVLAALTALVLARVLRRLLVERRFIPWLVIAFVFGTVYWNALTLSAGVWFTAHEVSALCLLLAADEALGRKRSWLVGLYLAGSFLSRQMTLFLTPFYAALLLTDTTGISWRGRFARGVGMAAVCGACGSAYLAFNWARFGDPLDAGYRYLLLNGVLWERFVQFGLFSPRYVPFNLFYLLAQGFHVQFAGARSLRIDGMDPFGTSLIAGSPFILAALAARGRKGLLWAAWISVALCAVPQLFYYNNGYWQINGQRFALDYLPVLMIVVGLGVERVQEKVWKGAIVYAVLLNILALVVVPALRA